jgi:hypothetical protein
MQGEKKIKNNRIRRIAFGGRIKSAKKRITQRRRDGEAQREN